MRFANGRSGFLSLAAVVAAIALYAFTASDSEAASKRKFSKRTHIGVRASDLVTLEYASVGDEMAFVRVLPDGTREEGAYRVPDGAVLVVTDVEYAVPHFAMQSNPDASVPALALELEVRNLADPSQSHRAFLSPRNLGDQRLEEDFPSLVSSQFGGAERLSSGFLVGSGAEVRPHLLTLASNPTPGFTMLVSTAEVRWVDVTRPFDPRPSDAVASSSAGRGKVILRGYLADEQ